MSGVSTKRCAGCGEIALVADRGRVKTVGETRYAEARANGDVVFVCVCGALVVWERQHESPVVR